MVQRSETMAKKKSTIRPLRDRILVERQEEERTSAGGIVIPDSATEKPIQGTVIAVGSGTVLDNGDVRPVDVKVGDNVLFGKYSGTEVKVGGEELLVLREDDVIGVIS
ncbi:MAG: chaperonin GroES [Gammaproteobacteria bacterium]|jgi:chaperonin GroES